MALGFGPSIEHSVATQPYVVDLLISFAYSSAHARSMRKYPTGMGLVVAQPVPNAIVQFTPGASSTSPPKDPPNGESKIPGIHVVDFILAKKEVVLDAEDPCDVVVGDWVEITSRDATQDPGRNVFHFRVASYTHPHMHLINPGLEYDNSSSGGIFMPQVMQENNLGGAPSRQSATATSSKDRIRVKLAAFKMKFDDLTVIQKDATILSLLRNMPSINDMTAYLQATKASGEPSFRNWTDRMCPAALGLLRWIVASNLSCIVQVDRYPGQPEVDALSNNASRLGQRVTNLDGWVQFRFAQGAPDKEQKFHKALSLKKGSISEEFPTLFAWHGSAVHNWHSIIRSGLDFNQIANGRAFGNGCYHSSNFQTSLGYCNARGGVFPCVSCRTPPIRLRLLTETGCRIEVLVWFQSQNRASYMPERDSQRPSRVY
jgi:ubiquitin-conjugating enzyme E2 Q